MYYAFKNLFPILRYFFVLPSNISFEFLLNVLHQAIIYTVAASLCTCFPDCSH